MNKTDSLLKLSELELAEYYIPFNTDKSLQVLQCTGTVNQKSNYHKMHALKHKKNK